MFKLSFIFVMVCGLFEWKRICAGFFYHLFMYVLRSEIQLSKGEGLDPIKQFNHVTFFVPVQTRTWISNVICHGLLCSASSVKMRWLFVLLILVELMTITVYNFLFINWFIIWLSLLKFLNLLLNVVYVYVFITCPARPLV